MVAAECLNKCLVVHMGKARNSNIKPLVFRPEFRVNGVIEILFVLNPNVEHSWQNGHFISIVRVEKGIRRDKGAIKKEKFSSQNSNKPHKEKE